MQDLIKKGRCNICDCYREFKYNSEFDTHLCENCKSSYHSIVQGRNIYDKEIDHPSHYQSEKLEVIEIIEAFNLNFSLGNAIKYILRAEKKDDYLQDLQKAKWYIEREIKAYSDE